MNDKIRRGSLLAVASTQGGGIDIDNYLTIVALEDGLTATLSGNTVEYCVDGDGNWKTLSSNTNSKSINKGQTLSFRGNLTPNQNYPYGIGTFKISKSCDLTGNCNSILFGDDAVNNNSLSGKNYAFRYLFQDCTTIRNVSSNFLPAITLAEDSCYHQMFYDCTSLTTAPELPATTLTNNCYESMFYGCSSLTTAPELPATTLANYCYNQMFFGCTSLTTAPTLPATTLAIGCYSYMFKNCSKLNYIKAMFTTKPSGSYTYNWVSGVASSGTFVKNKNATWNVTGTNGIPSGWAVELEEPFTPQQCLSLSIDADDITGKANSTTVYYTATVKGLDENNNTITKTITGTDAVEVGQNTSTTNSVTKTVSYTYMGVTATTTITQGPWTDVSYIVNLNNQWQLSSTVSNPNSSLYEGVYQSYANKGVNNSGDSMYIDINGYTNFKLYIRSYAESRYDYVMVSQLDKTLTYNSSYSNTTLVKAHTRGNQKSGTTINDYTLVEFTNIPSGSHRIQIIYRKDSSGNSGDDRGYVLIPKNQ